MTLAASEHQGLLPATQTLARSVLSVLLGSGLIVFAHLPGVTVVTGTLALLAADGGLGLCLQRRIGPPPTRLLMLWTFNLTLCLLLLLVIFVRQQPLGLGVLALMAAVTTGVWRTAAQQADRPVRRALELWTGLLFLSAAAVPTAWLLGLTPQDPWSPRVVGTLHCLLGGLMLWQMMQRPR
ncbi:hypothetical protein [Deinococcus yunweiensis]|uniref:hypothetical protein n=1 Tax=Deinococcus yunweiensis TaxID=367282 RepID=UPI00398F7A4C